MRAIIAWFALHILRIKPKALETPSDTESGTAATDNGAPEKPLDNPKDETAQASSEEALDSDGGLPNQEQRDEAASSEELR